MPLNFDIKTEEKPRSLFKMPDIKEAFGRALIPTTPTLGKMIIEDPERAISTMATAFPGVGIARFIRGALGERERAGRPLRAGETLRGGFRGLADMEKQPIAESLVGILNIKDKGLANLVAGLSTIGEFELLTRGLGAKALKQVGGKLVRTPAAGNIIKQLQSANTLADRIMKGESPQEVLRGLSPTKRQVITDILRVRTRGDIGKPVGLLPSPQAGFARLPEPKAPKGELKPLKVKPETTLPLLQEARKYERVEDFVEAKANEMQPMIDELKKLDKKKTLPAKEYAQREKLRNDVARKYVEMGKLTDIWNKAQRMGRYA